MNPEQIGCAQEYEKSKDQETQKAKEAAKSKLQSALSAELSPSNIDSLMENTLTRLGETTDFILEEYKKIKNIQSESSKELEDEAFGFFDLQTMPDILDAIDEKIENIKKIQEYITTNLVPADFVHTPPDIQEIPEGQGEQESREQKTEPRLKTLLYIIKTDFDLDPEETSLTKGTNSPNMTRKESYVTVVIPQLNRLVEINDEIGSRTFVYNLSELSKLGVSAENLQNMTKSEKKQWLIEHPLAGISVIETSNWRHDMSFYLSSEGDEYLVESESIATQKENTETESLPQVAKGENDPYRGFWTDEEGKHWGSNHVIVKRLKISQYTVERKAINIKENFLKDAQGRMIKKAYCLQEIEEATKELRLKNKENESLPQVSTEKKDPYKGFWTDKEGKHWGSSKEIGRKLKIAPETVERKAKNVKENFLRDRGGRLITKAYCLEEIEEATKEMRSAKQVSTEKKDPYKGFWTDEKGKHWGSAVEIAKRLKIAVVTVEKNATNIRVNFLRVVHGKIITKAYCLEEIEQATKELRLKNKENESLPQVAKEEKDPYKGFWTDEEGRHWGSSKKIGKRLRTSPERVERKAKSVRENSLRGSHGRSITKAYCLEEVEEILRRSQG